ncbi:DUF397 domain-containing protein [Streptomyces corynorhini]|uniref:DUF397 domain-containing protein n=1 Tax=Streptomyces corynorhini TaxID=2282652 RepID=A0A370B1Q6_9ACTN|nr:DUF397 domain-containing protein [Streptomyces corynorhini]RDG34592.1 DUF397 domain-containing protein [Streptomyces corynorhini]
MMTTADALTDAYWFKSSYSNAQGNECVEGARLVGGTIAVRDSKHPQGPAFVFPAPAWTAFVGALDVLASDPRP